jgi:hypothetical protein
MLDRGKLSLLPETYVGINDRITQRGITSHLDTSSRQRRHVRHCQRNVRGIPLGLAIFVKGLRVPHTLVKDLIVGLVHKAGFDNVPSTESI